METKKSAAKFAIFLLLFSTLIFAYFWPASRYVFQNHVLGAGQDSTAMPYFFWWLKELTHIAPLSLINTTLYSPQIGAPEGGVIWMPYVERVTGLIASLISTPEQSLYYSVALMLLLCGTLSIWLGRKMELSWSLSFALAVCAAFTPFTHYHSMIQPGFAAVYWLPVIFLGYAYLRKYFKQADKTRKPADIFLPSVLFLTVAATTHYFILIALTLIPVLYLFLLRRLNWKNRALAIAALIPLGLALVWVKMGPEIGVSHFKKEKMQISSIIASYENRGWDLLVYSARPIDYLTGNLDHSAWDINPLRKKLTKHVEQREPNWYPAERSSGVRWLLLLTIVPMILLRKRLPLETRHWVFVGLAFAVASYLFSLSPRCISPLGIGVGPSRWVHTIFPEMRAPNRWSPGVSFGLAVAFLSFANFYISKITSSKKRLLGSFLLVLWLILESPPTFSFPHYKPVPIVVRPKPCGFGAYFPYWNNDNMLKYNIATANRDTDCHILNLQRSPFVDHYFMKTLGEAELFNKNGSLVVASKKWALAQETLNCMGINWVLVEDPHKGNGAEICKRLGFKQFDGTFCGEPFYSLEKAKNRQPGEWLECIKDKTL